VRRLVSALLVASSLALVAASGALAGNGGFGPAAPVTPNGSRINDAYWFIFGFTAAVFLLVEATLVLFVIRYRRRGRPREIEGLQMHGSTRLEQLWTIVPVLILAAIAAFVLYKLPGIKDVPSARAGEQLTIDVHAHQFYWEFHYPNGRISVDKMVVPAGRVVRLEVTTPDVAHSWWIPRLGGKIDAIPGRTNTTWFETDRLGTYHGQCAEFCGLYHAAMKADVVVVRPRAYSEFLAGHDAGSPTVGKETFTGVCAKCHGSLGQGGYGPKIAGNATLADRQALEDLVRNGKGRMPAVGNDWPDAQVDALFRDLKGRFSSGG